MKTLPAALGVESALRFSRGSRFRRRGAAALARCIPQGMVIGGIVPTETDIVVAYAHAPDGTDRVIVKLARSARGARSLRRAADRLTELHADPRLDGWEVPTPVILDLGELDGFPYVVESAMSGEPIARLLDRGAASEPLTDLATQAIAGLHRRTASVLAVDADVLDRWIGQPVLALEQLVAASPHRAAMVRELGSELAARLENRNLAAGWIHGDYAPNNVLIDAHAGRIAGIVDWELAGTPELPVIDRTMFLLATHLQSTGRQLGSVVAEIAKREASNSLLGSLVPARAAAIDRVLDPRSVTLLCWLRHVAPLVTRSERMAADSAWKRHNVYQVLDALAER